MKDIVNRAQVMRKQWKDNSINEGPYVLASADTVGIENDILLTKALGIRAFWCGGAIDGKVQLVYCPRYNLFEIVAANNKLYFDQINLQNEDVTVEEYNVTILHAWFHGILKAV